MCVVCVGLWVLQLGHSRDGCDLASILCKYDLRNVIYLLILGQGCDD